MKKILILTIICTMSIGVWGCTKESGNEDLKKITNEESHENNQKGDLSLYKDSKEDYIDVPNLIGDTQISNLRFALNEDKSVNGYQEIEDFDMKLLDNISSFKDIENLLKTKHDIKYREFFVDIKLDEVISDPNIILSRANDIGVLAANHDFDLSELPRNGKELTYMINSVAIVAKLDGLGLNLTDDAKFKLLNYLIDNTENIKEVDSPEEIFSYVYILNCLFEAFMNSKSGTFAYLQGIEILLDHRLHMISYEEPDSIQEELLKGACNWIDEGLEKMKTYK